MALVLGLVLVSVLVLVFASALMLVFGFVLLLVLSGLCVCALLQVLHTGGASPRRFGANVLPGRVVHGAV